MNAPSGTYSCGASILDATHVVTAAHCVYIDDTLLAPANVSVGYGSTDVLGLTGAGVSEVAMPAAYLSDDSYDVAVLQLSVPLINFGAANVKPIPLGTQARLATAITAGDDAIATGWGALTEDGPSPRYVQEVPLPLRDDAICSAFPGYQSS